MTDTQRLVWQGRGQLVLLSLILLVLVAGDDAASFNAGELGATAGAILYGFARVVARFTGNGEPPAEG